MSWRSSRVMSLAIFIRETRTFAAVHPCKPGMAGAAVYVVSRDFSCATGITDALWVRRQKFSKATRRIAFQTFWR